MSTQAVTAINRPIALYSYKTDESVWQYGPVRVTLQHTSGSDSGVPWHILNRKTWAAFLRDAQLHGQAAVAMEDSILRQLTNAYYQLRPIGADCNDGEGRYVQSIRRDGSRIFVELTTDRGAAAFFSHAERETLISDIHLEQHRSLCVCSLPFTYLF